MFMIFVFVIPGQFKLPKAVVQIGPYNNKYTTCRKMKRRRDKKPFHISCGSLKGRTVKIELLNRGRLSLCEVAVYGKHS